MRSDSLYFQGPFRSQWSAPSGPRSRQLFATDGECSSQAQRLRHAQLGSHRNNRSAIRGDTPRLSGQPLLAGLGVMDGLVSGQPLLAGLGVMDGLGIDDHVAPGGRIKILSAHVVEMYDFVCGEDTIIDP